MNQPVFYAPSTSADAPPQLTLDEAFDFLVQVVDRIHTLGRSTRSAAIKPALQSETRFRFSERALGFASFRDFLYAAQANDKVLVRPAPVGPDVDVYPLGVTPANNERNGEPPIRRDLWKAFVDWSPRLVRYFDKHSCLALVLENPGELDASDYRSKIPEQPERFVSIQPINIERMLQWMREFAESRPPGADRDSLIDALRQPRPLQDFTSATRSGPSSKPWVTFRLRKVREFIQEWGTEHGVDIDVHRAPEAKPDEAPSLALSAHTIHGVVQTGTATGYAASVVLPDVNDLQSLREWAHRMVDRMGPAELMRLPIDLNILLSR